MTINSLDVLLFLFAPVCCSMSSSNCCFLTYIQVSQEADQVVWYSHLFQNFPQFIVIHTVKGFGIVNKAEVDVFLELSCFFNDPSDVANLTSYSSAFSKISLNILPLGYIKSWLRQFAVLLVFFFFSSVPINQNCFLICFLVVNYYAIKHKLKSFELSLCPILVLVDYIRFFRSHSCLYISYKL